MKHAEHANRQTKTKLKWWQWVAVGLMLLAIGTYVLTLDDSVVPTAGGKAGSSPAGSGASPR